MKNKWSKNPGIFGRIISGTAAFIFCCLTVFGQSSPPMMVQVPFVGVAAGNIVSGASSTSPSASCTNGLSMMGASTTGSPTGGNYGDGCPANEVGISAPWGAAVDAWGNVYFSDYGHEYVRVIYAGAVTVNGVANPATAMIEGAYANGASWSTRAAVTPVAGNVYAIAGGYTTNITSKNSDGSYACNNVANGTSPDTLSGSAEGSGCPATYSYVKGPYAPAVDSAGNVFVVDKSNSLVYEVIANASSLGAQLVTVENPSVTAPQVGYIYVVAGKGGGYVDGVLASAGQVHAPFGVSVDASENVYIADGTNNAVRMVNGPNNTTSGGVGAGFIHTIAGNCTSSGCTALSAAPSSNVAAVGAGFLAPMGVAADSYGNVYIGDNSAGTSTVPTTVRVIYSGGASNPVAQLICLENSGTSFCPSSGAPALTAGYVYTVAGNGDGGNSGKGDGLLATASGVAFDRLEGLALDAQGNIYIADYGSHSVISQVNASTGLLTFLLGDGQTSFAAGDYCAGAAAAIGPTMSDSYGDGCPAPQSIVDHLEGNLAIDSSGNIFFADNGYNLLRKLTFNSTGVSGGSFPATAVGGTATAQNLAFELLAGSSTPEPASNVSVAVLTQGASTGSEFADAGTTAGDTCTQWSTLALTSMTNSSTDTVNTVCVVPVTFTPAKVGARSGAVQITGTVNGTAQVLATAYVNGTGNGAALAIDPGAASIVGSGGTPHGVATDSSGNAYIAYQTGNMLYSAPGGPFATTPGTGLAAPNQVAVDGAGNVFVADTSNNRIAEFVGGATTPVTAVSGLNAPEGVAVDGAGNLYIADTGDSRVLYRPLSNGLSTALGSGFQSPVAVAVDGSGNVYVADSGTNSIVKLAVTDGAVTATTTVASGIIPMGIAVDAAGDLYYGASGKVTEIPVSGTSIVVASGFTSPVGVALDPNGNLYVADSASNSGISFFNRTASTQYFGTSSAPGTSSAYGTTGPLLATLTNIGNASDSGINDTAQTDSADFVIAASSTNGCSSLTSLMLSAGEECGVDATFNTSSTNTSSDITDTVTINGTTAGSIGAALTLVANNAPVYATTTDLSNLAPTSPSYGTAVSLTATVSCTPSSSCGTVGGTVTFTVTNTSTSTTVTPAPTCTLSGSGLCQAALSSTLTAGSYTVTASYGGYSGSSAVYSSSSTASATSFTVAQVTPTLTWAPTSYTQTTGVAIGTSDLNAVVATPSGLTGTFVYTATQGSTVNTITSSTTTLGVGQWELGVTFTPTDTTDYASVTVSNAAIYTVSSVSIGTTTAITSQTASPVYAGPTALTASVGVSVTPASGTTAPTGSITLALTPVGGGATVNAVGTLTSGSTSTSTAVVNVYGLSAGTYNMTASYSGGSSFAISTSGTGSITVAQATFTITVNNQSMVYNNGGSATLPTFTGTSSGAIGSDSVTVSYSTTATATSPVVAGGYPITATISGSSAANYHASVTAGTLTITPLGITATPNAASTVYGTLPTITGSLSGVISRDVANVSASYTSADTLTAPVGSYQVTGVTLSGSAAGNYTVTIAGAPVYVVVSQATVTAALTGSLYSRAYGAANPAFTGTLTGVLSQDVGNVSPVFTSAATSTSPVNTSAGYPITASSLTGSAAGNYLLGNTGASLGVLDVTQASTTTALSTSNASIGIDSQVTFTATVTSGNGIAPSSGSVVFSAGTATLCTQSLSSTGTASCSSSSLQAGSLSITATYAGNVDFAGSTSTALIETISFPGVTGTPAASSVTVQGGSASTVSLTLTAVDGYTGTATYGCAFLPAGMTCSFNPASATFTSAVNTATTVLTISTKSSSTMAALLSPSESSGQHSPRSLALAAGIFLPGALIGMLGIGRSKKLLLHRMMLLVVLLTSMAGMAVLSGCGGSAGTSQTPAGSYNIQVEVTAGTVQSIPLTVVVQ